jgi:glutamate formiminotransferase
VLESVINISEGRDLETVAAIGAAGGSLMLDVHSDPDHNRSVLTLAGPAADLSAAVRNVAAATVSALDLGAHQGVHPRIGVLDVVPFVYLGGNNEAALSARNSFASWAGTELQLPCFLYGPERTLPDLRRHAWSSLAPDTGPTAPHPTAGAAAVGARPVLVAYNLWLASAGLDTARAVAAAIRGPHIRALGLAVANGATAQVSCNLIAPWKVGPGAVFDAVASRAEVGRAELVGLAPRAILDAEPPARWAELGLDPSTTIEARLQRAGLDGGRLTIRFS